VGASVPVGGPVLRNTTDIFDLSFALNTDVIKEIMKKAGIQSSQQQEYISFNIAISSRIGNSEPQWSC
jgi:hypothetical protein